MIIFRQLLQTCSVAQKTTHTLKPTVYIADTTVRYIVPCK